MDAAIRTGWVIAVALLALSVVALAGCGVAVPNAPPRTFDDTDPRVLFRTRYHGGAWVDGAMDGCGHYMWCP